MNFQIFWDCLCLHHYRLMSGNASIQFPWKLHFLYGVVFHHIRVYSHCMTLQILITFIFCHTPLSYTMNCFTETCIKQRFWWHMSKLNSSASFSLHNFIPNFIPIQVVWEVRHVDRWTQRYGLFIHFMPLCNWHVKTQQNEQFHKAFKFSFQQLQFYFSFLDVLGSHSSMKIIWSK
jgi:hypothetical protein